MDERTPEDGTPGAEREPRPGTLRVARAIGARLRRPLPDGARDVLAARLAAAAAEAHAVTAPSRWRTVVLRRPVALVGAVSVLAVVVAGVGLVTRTDTDLPVIVLAAGGAGPEAAGAMAADAGAEAGASRDMASPEALSLIWQPTRYTFELADGVTLDVERAPVWRFVPPDAADLAADAERIAAALGLPAPGPAEGDPGSWSVQREDGANLWVAASGDWFYGGPYDLWSVWDCPVVEPVDVPADGEADEAVDIAPAAREGGCTEPTPPAGVPDEARARELAAALLADLGVGDVRITEVYADEWSAWVTVELPLPDGSGPSGLSFGVGFAGEERVASASGTLASLERLGDYPLLDVAASLPRLADELNAWLDGDMVARPMPLPAVEPGEGEVGILPMPEPMPGPEPEPMPIEPGPGAEGSEEIPPPVDPEDPFETPEPVDRTVVIVAAELVTSTAWTADGTLVLLPHYRLTDADGGWWWVVAVADGYVTR